MGGAVEVGTSLKDVDFEATIPYLPPEFFILPREQLQASPMIDIWALGICAFQIFSGSSLLTFWCAVFGGQASWDRISEKVKSDKFNQDFVDGVIDSHFKDASVRHFLKAALCIDPDERSSVSALERRALIRCGHSLAVSKIFTAINNVDTHVRDSLEENARLMETLLTNMQSESMSMCERVMRQGTPVTESQLRDVLDQTLMTQPSVVSDENQQQLMAQMQQVLAVVHSISNTQQADISGLTKIPLVYTVQKVSRDGFVGAVRDKVTSKYEIDFICCVCGKGGSTYSLEKLKQWVREVAGAAESVLTVIEVAGCLAGLPVPHLGRLMQRVSSVIPDGADEAMQMGEALCSYVNEFNDEGGSGCLPSWNTGQHAQRPSPVLTYSHFKGMKVLLAVLGDENADKCGLTRVQCEQGADKGMFSWVCEGCGDSFRKNGSSCLQINPVFK